MKKGISPLIATVLLVAIVVSITTIVGPEVLRIVEEGTEDAVSGSLEKIDCERSEITLEEVVWYEQGLGVHVRNTGKQELTDFRLELSVDGQWKEYSVSGGEEILSPGDSRTFTVDEEIGDVEEGVFISGTCPNWASRDIPEKML